MTFSEALEIIRERLKSDIADIIGGYIELRGSGSNFKAICPFHDEKTPSFRVSAEKGIFKCFGCGQAGDAIDFIMEHEGMSFQESIEKLASRYGLHIDGHNNAESTLRHENLESILPGITKKKRAIRKQKHVLLVFNQSYLDPDPQSPSLFIDGTLSRRQARHLRAFTGTCLILRNGIRGEGLFDTIASALSAGHDLYFYLDETGRTDWLEWVLAHLPMHRAVQKLITQSLASIEDPVKRSVYITTFTNHLHKMESKKN